MADAAGSTRDPGRVRRGRPRVNSPPVDAIAHRRNASPPVRSSLVQQRTLGELAIAVAQARPLDVIYALAAEEALRVAEAGAVRIVRHRPDGVGVVVGSFGLCGPQRSGSVAPNDAGSGVPIMVHGENWGAIVVSMPKELALQADGVERLGILAELVGLAVANADDSARLLFQASTDPVTGLLNYRAFQERYESEFARAVRYQRPLSLVLLDLDYFKMINDAYGHGAGNEALTQVARMLTNDARPSDLIARIGGDEFALLLPETTAAGALLVAERCRKAIHGAPVGVAAHLTLSAGVCDLVHADTHGELMRLADDALYWAKSQGRDNAVSYAPEIVKDLSASDREDRLQRSHSLLALRSLARAIDAKDPAALGHSERVAELVRRLAIAADWPVARATRLADAALLHDVGKLGVPDSILSKAGALTAGEYELVKTHAALSAQIAADALSDEQTTWIHQHHERPDGSGYPDGLEGAAISDGARLLALADSWDVMTTGRNYRHAISSADALLACSELVASQFFGEAYHALADVIADDQAQKL